MLPFLIIIVLFIMFMMYEKTNNFKNQIIHLPITTVGYDFDDCLREYKTKKDIMSVVNKMLSDHQNGKRVVIITARGTIGKPEIVEFLKKYGKTEDQIKIYTTGDNFSRKKSPVIKQLGVDVFYDDQEGYLQDVKINCPNVKLYKTVPTDPDGNIIQPFVFSPR